MIPLRETVTSVTLRSATTDTAYARQVYYGFSLENGNRGILFHSMGINGNTFTAMNRNPQIVRAGRSVATGTDHPLAGDERFVRT